MNHKKGMAIIIILCFALVHYQGTQIGSKMQNGLIPIKIIIILLITFMSRPVEKGEGLT